MSGAGVWGALTLARGGILAAPYAGARDPFEADRAPHDGVPPWPSSKETVEWEAHRASETEDLLAVVQPHPEDPALQQARASLEAATSELHDDLAQLERTRQDLGGREAAARLCELDRRLLAAECEAAKFLRRPREHPVLPVARGWMERLRATGLPEDARRAEALTSDLECRSLRQRLRRCEEARDRSALEASDVQTDQLRDRLFDALLATEELRLGVKGRAERIGPAGGVDTRSVLEEARRVRAQLRKELAQALTIAPADAPRRDEWAGRLVDHGDEALVAALEVEERVGARILGEARDALEWHLKHVESARDGGSRGPGRRLRRRVRRLEAERLELELQVRLERTFSRRLVILWERAVLLAIVFVIGLLVASIWYGGSRWLLWADTAVCAFLVVDFLVKAFRIDFDRHWMRRHVLTDLLPAIPFGLIVINAGSAELSPLLKALRIQKVARSLRVLLPIIRLYRASTFVLRGLDRIVRQNARFLMKETLVFPTPAERRQARAGTRILETRIWSARNALETLFARSLEARGASERAALASARLACFQCAVTAKVPTTDSGQDLDAVRRAGLPIAEDLLDRLSRISSDEVEGRLGPDALARLARGARVVARSPLRRLPFLRRWVPVDAGDLSDRRVAARVIRSVARSAATLENRVLWWADLKGTLTPGELVGRVGSTLVARSARPAVRLLAIGGAYLLLRLMLHGLGYDPDDAVMLAEGYPSSELEGAQELGGPASERASRDLGGLRGFVLEVFAIVNRLTGVVLVVLGSVCLAFLGVGAWLQRLARDTTVFHEQVARAQFLHLTESIKAREKKRDAELLEERVFRPERALRGASWANTVSDRDEARFLSGLERFMTAGVSPPSQGVGFDAVARSVMLYRDLLDGALLVHSDTRATSQLLGNLALQRMMSHAGRVDAGMRQALRGLDLERRRTFLSGPYLWFHSITRALASRSARLIVDYNAHAIPRSELKRAAPEECRRYEAWLARKSYGVDRDGQEESVRESARGRAAQLTTAFTALHFLDRSEARDEEVATRFGPEVLSRLRADRKALVRSVFGTSPLHEQPLESRILNLRLLYADWIEGGKVWLAPLRLTAVGVRASALAARALARAVATIRRPEAALSTGAEAEADFHAAARKIDRMRGPGALVALELRAILDPEYFGLPLPGVELERDAGSAAPKAWADADFLRATPAVRDRLATHRARSARCLAQLERECAAGLLDRLSSALGVSIHRDQETLRALALIMVADDDGVRSGLFGPEVLAGVTCDALTFGLPHRRPLLALRLRVRFERWWRRGGGREHLTSAAVLAGALPASTNGGDEGSVRKDGSLERARWRRVKRAAWCALLANEDGARAAFEAARLPGSARAAARSAVESRLADALRHPARITEQIVTLRAIQTLSLVDVRDYRRHVWKLGEFSAAGEPGDVLVEIPDTSQR